MTDQGRRGRGRVALAVGAALGVVGGVAYRLNAGKRAAPTPLMVGSVVPDDEFYADERYIHDHLVDATIGDWRTRIFDQGPMNVTAGDVQGPTDAATDDVPIFFVPIIKGLEVVYAKQLRLFAETHRVLLYERTESLDRPVGTEVRAEEIRRVLDHLGIERAHIVALGDAGIPAFNFVRDHPSRCRSLTVLCLGPRYKVPPFWLNEGIINTAMERLPLEYIVPGSVVRKQVLRGLAGTGRLPAHLIGHMLDYMPEQTRLYKYSILPMTRHHEMAPWAHRITVPTLLMDRDDDRVAPVAEMQELAALLPQCHGLFVFNDGGRFITYTWADPINARLREFFAAVKAGTPATYRFEEVPG
ncbi:MAG TPA: alpha/beta hydrolase [Thermomicrobiales bacterium]